MVDQDDIDVITRSEIDMELAKMRSMSAEEAAAVAAQAVAEAETAMAEAEEAAKDAEAAEADADAAHVFAEAAMKTLKGRSVPRMVIASDHQLLFYRLNPCSSPKNASFMLSKNMIKAFSLT